MVTTPTLDRMNRSPTKESEYLENGARVRLTKLGEIRNPKANSRIGTVVGRTQSAGRYYVRLDGNRVPTILHRTYIQPVTEPTILAGLTHLGDAQSNLAGQVYSDYRAEHSARLKTRDGDEAIQRDPREVHQARRRTK